MKLDIDSGLIDTADFVCSPNCDGREAHAVPEVIIIHCISLPPGQYGNGAIQRFFQNELGADEHSYFQSMAHLTVSAHFLIERNGMLIQFVPVHKRAWHAGESVCLGKSKVNDFSIGIELEGLDTDINGFTDAQYDQLNCLIEQLKSSYPSILSNNIFAHSDIAPGRKPDPGPYFDFQRLKFV
ncbi:MAG: AmpD protein [Arenicella sp.]|jgi:AmpD protein